jgi:hypothetical protein
MGVMEVIEGISKKDMDKVEQMLEVKDACEVAGVPVPKEVEDYLEIEHEVVGKLRPGIDKGVVSIDEDSMSIIEIDLSKIDRKIDIIRITKSW